MSEQSEKKPPADAGPVDQRVRRVRINVGAPVGQDFGVGRWPATKSGADVDEDMPFDAEWNGRAWECRADGYGRRTWLGEFGGYGSGCIHVFDLAGVTFLDEAPNVELTGRHEQD